MSIRSIYSFLRFIPVLALTFGVVAAGIAAPPPPGTPHTQTERPPASAKLVETMTLTPAALSAQPIVPRVQNTPDTVIKPNAEKILVRGERAWPPLPYSFANVVAADKPVVVLVDGPCYFAHNEQNAWYPLKEGQILVHGDLIRTGDHGYLAVAYSLRNLVLIKPKSGLRLRLDNGGADNGRPSLTFEPRFATVMLACEDATDISIESPKANFTLSRGEATVQVTRDGETYRAVRGDALVRLTGDRTHRKLAEGTYLEIAPDGKDHGPLRYDTSIETEAFRRFANLRERFAKELAAMSPEVTFKASDLLLNGTMIGRMPTDPTGFKVFTLGDRPAPKRLDLRFKLHPYPTPRDRFEIQLGTEVVYPVTELGDGGFACVFPTPSFPEIDLRLFGVDHLGRRQLVHRERIVIPNRSARIDAIRAFLHQLELAFTRADWQYVREHIAWDYRDSFGMTYDDFYRLIEDSLRQYRDVRLRLFPHNFNFQQDRVQVAVSYNLTAIAPSLIGRFESRGSDLLSLVEQDGQWKITSKFRGLFFQRFRHVLDERRGVIIGQVTNEIDGSPVSGATVSIAHTRYRTTTDGLGEYTFYNLPPGRYDLEISKNGFGSLTLTSVEVRATGTRY